MTALGPREIAARSRVSASLHVYRSRSNSRLPSLLGVALAFRCGSPEAAVVVMCPTLRPCRASAPSVRIFVRGSGRRQGESLSRVMPNKLQKLRVRTNICSSKNRVAPHNPVSSPPTGMYVPPRSRRGVTFTGVRGTFTCPHVVSVYLYLRALRRSETQK